LRDVHGFRGGRFGLDAEQAGEAQAYLTILPISKPNDNVVVQVKVKGYTFSDQ
jgi:hypothetical protein